MKIKVSVAIAALSFACGAQAGTIVNGGFEDGLNNWAALLPTSVAAVTAATAYNGTTYNAVEGSKFALISGGSLPLQGFIGQPTDGALLLTGLTVNSGEALTFSWAFLGKDYLPFDDFGGVSFNGVVNGASFNQTTTLASIGSVGDRGDSGWKTFSFTPNGNFVGSITFFAANKGDTVNVSQFAVDNLQIAAVPEPETYAMFLAGLGIMGAVARRRSKKA